MAISFDRSVRVPADVLMSELDGESVLLNLKTEVYFGLDAVGTRMWNVVTVAPSIQAAYDTLHNEYDVDPIRLREDLRVTLEKWLEQGLIEVVE